MTRATLPHPRSAILRSYGQWIATLAPWSEFVTLTHKPRAKWGSWSKVGIGFHRRMVKAWFYGDPPFKGIGVLDADPRARWWSETELHQTGIPHEHGVLATGVDALGRKAMRDAWRYVLGDPKNAQGARFDRIHREVETCMYVAKYTEKSATQEPRIFGFGTQDDLLTIGRELREHPDSMWSRAAIDEVQPRLLTLDAL